MAGNTKWFSYWLVCVEFNAAYMELLRPLTNLTQIDVPAANATVETIQHLSALTNIQVLYAEKKRKEKKIPFSY